jgi:hypothetical protein
MAKNKRKSRNYIISKKSSKKSNKIIQGNNEVLKKITNKY